MRIEVGYGLEGALNDATAKRIIAETITPYFKRNELFSGIDAGATAIMKVIRGEVLPPPAITKNESSPMIFFISMMIGMTLFFLVATVMIIRYMKKYKESIPNAGNWSSNSESSSSSGSSSGSSGGSGSDSTSGGGGESGGGGASGSW